MRGYPIWRTAIALAYREKGGSGLDWPSWAHYVLALGAVGATLFARWLLDGQLGNQMALGSVMAVLLPLIVLVHPRAFLVAALAGLSLAWYFFVSPRNSLKVDEPAELLRLVTLGLAISGGAIAAWLSSRARQRKLLESYESDRRRAARLAVTQILAESRTFEESAPRILQAVCEHLGWDTGGVWRVDANGQVLYCVEFWSKRGLQFEHFEQITRGLEFASGVGLPGRVWASAKPAWIQDVVKDGNFPRAPIADREGLHGAFALPISAGGNVLGVVEFFSREIRQPDEDLLEMATTIGAQIGQFVERTRADGALRESEQRFRVLADAAPVLIWMSGPNKEGIYFNHTWLEFTGRSFEEQIGDKWLQLVHHEDSRQLAQTCGRGFETRTPFTAEFRLKRADGEYRWLLDSGVPRFDEAGNFVGFIGSCVDITDRKAAEEARTRLAEIVDSSEDAIISKSLDGIILSWNAAAERLYGWSAAEALGKPIEMIIPTELRAQEQNILDRLRCGQRVEHFETVRVTKDGRRLDISLTISPVRDGSGRIVGASKVARDITQRKAAERQIAALSDELRRRLEEQARRAAQQGALYQLTDRLARAVTLNETYEAALDSIVEALACDRASILLYDEGGVMRFMAWRGLPDQYRAAVEGHSPWGPDEPDPQPVTITDLREFELEAGLKSVILGTGIRALGFIPLMANGRLIGKFMIYFDAPHVFSDEELDLSLTIARQVAFGVQRSSAEAQRRNAEQALRESEVQHRRLSARLKLLLETTSHLIKSLETEELLQSVLDLARDIVAADAFALWRVDPSNTWRVVSSKGLSEEFLQETLGAAQTAALPGGPVVVQPEDLKSQSTPILHERWKRYEREGVQSLMILPLLIHGAVTGTLVFYCRSPHHFTQSEVESANALSNIAAAAITTSELYEAQSALRKPAEEAAVRESFLAATGALLSESLSYEQTLANVARAAVPDFADWCAVDLMDEQGVLRRLAVAHVDPEKLELARELLEKYQPEPERRNGPLHVIRTGEAEMMSDIPGELVDQAARDEHHLDLLRRADIRSYICVPLRVGQRVCGAITFVSGRAKRRFDERDLSVAQEIARRSAQAIDNARLYANLSEADRRKDEFLATLAHELRNPLAPIRNALEIIRRNGADATALQSSHGVLERQVQQLVRLVDDLLDVSRITRDRLELRKSRVELAPVIEQAVETCRPLAENDNHSIELALAPQPIYIEADAVRLAQVFANLLNNACKFTPPGGRIRIAAERHGSDVVVTVADNGVGIPSEKLHSIFEMFSQVDRTLERARGGMGIGLTLVRRLVELHGGSVQARSDGPDRGSEFTVRLPIVIEPAVAPGDARRMLKAVESPPEGAGTLVGGRQLLIVDDNLDSARTLGMLLRMAGWQIQLAHDGDQALERANATRPAVILLDIGLPGKNGHEVCRAIRREAWGASAVIIALTGWGQEEDRARSREAGFDAHLVKPLDPQALPRVIDDLLAARRDA